jgi:hypothetical protein
MISVLITNCKPIPYTSYSIIQGEISSSHGGEYDVQSCLLGCTAV